MDVIKTATRGSVCDPPVKVLPKSISLDLFSSSEEFYMPCVISRTGWVKRTLIPQKIGAIIDFSELYMAKLASDEKLLVGEHLDFLFNVNTVPIKITNILRGLIDNLHGPGASQLQVRDN